MALRKIALAALALVVASANAPAVTMSNNCRVDLRCVQADDGVHAFVQIDAIWGALIDADLRILVNGQQVKLEPILTHTQQTYSTWIAPRGTSVSACAIVEGRNWISNESWLPAQTSDCAYVSSETGFAGVRRAPVRLGQSLHPTASLAPRLRP